MIDFDSNFESTNEIWAKADSKLKELITDLLSSTWSRPGIADVLDYPFFSDEITTPVNISYARVKVDVPVGWEAVADQSVVMGVATKTSLLDSLTETSCAKGLAVVLVTSLPSTNMYMSTHSVVNQLHETAKKRAEAAGQELKVVNYPSESKRGGRSGHRIAFIIGSLYYEVCSLHFA